MTFVCAFFRDFGGGLFVGKSVRLFYIVPHLRLFVNFLHVMLIEKFFGNSIYQPLDGIIAFDSNLVDLVDHLLVPK